MTKPKAKPKVAFARVQDKSLQAYKDMIRGFARAVNAKKAEISEEEWIALWKEFWGDNWEGDAEHPKE